MVFIASVWEDWKHHIAEITRNGHLLKLGDNNTSYEPKRMRRAVAGLEN